MKHRKNILTKSLALVLLMAMFVPVLTGSEVAAAYSLKKPSFTVTKRTKTKAVIKIDKKGKATGCQIYMKKGKKGKYRLCAVAFTKTCEIKKLKPGSEYYVKICSYRTQGSRIIKSKFSSVKKIGKYKKPSKTKKPSAEQYAEDVLALVNEERTKNGLSPLVLDAKLCEAATVRANEIIENFDHIRPDGTSCFTVLDENDIHYICVGENIAAGQSTPAEVMANWTSSPDHRANILSPDFGKLGVGFVKTSSGYQYYWVQIFTD